MVPSGFSWTCLFPAGLRIQLAESTSGDQGAGNDDITNFLRTALFTTFLAKSAILKSLIFTYAKLDLCDA